MKLDELLRDPIRSLHHMERYVNDGSPSGFTFKYRTSPRTDPFGNVPYFDVMSFALASDAFDSYGEYDPKTTIRSDVFLVHPDMRHHRDLENVRLDETSEWRAVPTSSSRTVRLAEYGQSYVKLHYDGIIGRIYRRLPRRKAINGPEMSWAILRAIEASKLPHSVAILHEPFAKMYRNPGIEDGNQDWSFIWRESSPRGRTAHLIAFMAPLFALWAKDRHAPDCATLLAQLVSKWGKGAEEILTEAIIYPIIDIYFSLIVSLGLQDELNAQNLLIGFDTEFHPVAVVLRDMMGIEKDVTIREQLGLSTAFDAKTYKVIGKCIDEKKYVIRHSFSFDFKLSEYVIKPLVAAASTLRVFRASKKRDDIKGRVKG